MDKKRQSTQQPSRRVSGQEEKRSWDTPSRPITPTPADTAPPNTPGQPAQQPTQPAQQPSQPSQQPAQPTPNPQSSTEKSSDLD